MISLDLPLIYRLYTGKEILNKELNEIFLNWIQAKEAAHDKVLKEIRYRYPLLHIRCSEEKLDLHHDNQSYLHLLSQTPHKCKDSISATDLLGTWVRPVETWVVSPFNTADPTPVRDPLKSAQSH